MQKRLATSAAILLAASVLLMGSRRASTTEQAEYHDAPVNLTRYYVALKLKGPNRTQSDAEASRIQAAHLRFLREQNEAGRFVLSGPFIDDGDIRGLSIVVAGDIEEAERIVAEDPAVKAGRLRFELHPAMFPNLTSTAQYRAQTAGGTLQPAGNPPGGAGEKR
jgi:uncharacterized protein YciI